MTVQEFINDFKKDKVANTNINDHVVSDYIKKKLEVKEYIPVVDKQNIIKAVVDSAMENDNGFITINSITQYIGFVVSMLMSHTNLHIEDAYDDYDLLSQTGLLNAVISTFQEDYEACNIFLNMYVNDTLQYNSTQYQLASFMDKIGDNLQDIIATLRCKVEEINLTDLLKDANVSSETIDSILESLK